MYDRNRKGEEKCRGCVCVCTVYKHVQARVQKTYLFLEGGEQYT